ncbi:MAG: excinuclease ABC subunit UvrB [Thaumarchaeota archaeon]|nr:excinuclease ABC subunit UvrB [Nitrososphaerota archaeon]
MTAFQIKSKLKPKGDQPKAIASLSDGLTRGFKHQTLLGATGTGKTFTLAHVIAEANRPALVISPNKTLAAQLTTEFRSYFPDNSVEYFVSYYDYYTPEAYVPKYDLYIEKDVAINEQIDTLRHKATQSLLTRRDSIVVASVSCIFGLGSPREYRDSAFMLRRGQEIDRDEIIAKLIDLRYQRTEILQRGKFRARGDILEICTVDDGLTRIEMYGNAIEKIVELDILSGSKKSESAELLIFPAKHFVTSKERLETVADSIEKELEQRVRHLKRKKKFLEMARLEERTRLDLEMIRETGYCPGIENYTRYFTERKHGAPPNTLLNFFPDDFLTIIDESHVTIPQLRGMYEGDRSRKENLIQHGFRLPSAFDNRPLTFTEFERKVGQVIYSSATPAQYEREKSNRLVEQIIRPTGLVDPKIVIRPSRERMKDLVPEINRRREMGERVLITVLTKKMAEKLTSRLADEGIRVRYLHSDVETLERVALLKDLRLGKYDVLVGINLLREGLDLPEVSLVAIFDADKEGFLRTETSLIQTIGRASRNVSGEVIMYADSLSRPMTRAINETNRRREVQVKFNGVNHIIPETVRNEIRALTDTITGPMVNPKTFNSTNESDDDELTRELEEAMLMAADNLDFERAAEIRNELVKLGQLDTRSQ